MKRTVLAFMTASVVATFATTLFAAQSGAALRNEGPMLFKQYCATCHGLGAKGDGPTAASLKKTPADLTQLQLKGQPFPGTRVEHQITGEGEMTTAHGTREMPVWGRVFRYTKGTPPPQMAIYRLIEYIQGIQVNK